MNLEAVYFTGLTSDFQRLVGGLFSFKDTHGIPLDLSYDFCKEHKLCPDWCDYLLDAGSQTQWKWDSAFDEMALLVGQTVAAEIKDRYDFYCASQWRPGEGFRDLNQRLLDLKKRGAKSLLEFERKAA